MALEIVIEMLLLLLFCTQSRCLVHSLITISLIIYLCSLFPVSLPCVLSLSLVVQPVRCSCCDTALDAWKPMVGRDEGGSEGNAAEPIHW